MSRRRGPSQAEALAAEYSPKVAAAKPPRESPEQVRARTDRAIAAAVAQEHEARRRAREAIRDRRELEKRAERLRRALRGEE